jgi:hypothetical protein
MIEKPASYALESLESRTAARTILERMRADQKKTIILVRIEHIGHDGKNPLPPDATKVRHSFHGIRITRLGLRQGMDCLPDSCEEFDVCCHGDIARRCHDRGTQLPDHCREEL